MHAPVPLSPIRRSVRFLGALLTLLVASSLVAAVGAVPSIEAQGLSATSGMRGDLIVEVAADYDATDGIDAEELEAIAAAIAEFETEAEKRGVEVLAALETSATVLVSGTSAELSNLVAVSSVVDVASQRLMSVTSTTSSSSSSNTATVGLDRINSDLTGAGQLVAVVDTGTDVDHPALSGKIAYEACYSTTDLANGARSTCANGVDGPGDSSICAKTVTSCGHGTHVAGVAVGRKAVIDGELFSGIAPDAGLLSFQVFSEFNNPGLCGSSSACVLAYTFDVLSALDHIVLLTQYDVDIAAVNLSLGFGAHTDTCPNEVGADLFAALHGQGVPVVAATGNSSEPSSVSWPACVPSVIAVTASGGASTVADYTDIAWFANAGSQVDIAAPGRLIPSSIPNNRYAAWSGTSMAAPHVAGAAALHSEAGLTEDFGKALLRTDSEVQDARTGTTYPQLDIPSLLGSSGEVPPTAPTQPPTPPTQPPTPNRPAEPSPADDVVLTQPNQLVSVERFFDVGWESTGTGELAADIRRQVTSWFSTPGQWATISSADESSGDRYQASPGVTYCFQARRSGSSTVAAGEWSSSKCRAVPVDDLAFTATSGDWGVLYRSNAYEATVRASAERGATLTLPGVSAKRVFLVVTACPDCGAVRVSYSGKSIGVVDLRHHTYEYQRIIPVSSFDSVVSGDLVVTVETSGKPVHVDAVIASSV